MKFIEINKLAKNSKPISVIILTVVIFVGVILAWQDRWLPKEEAKTSEQVTKDETTDWKTYDWNGISFKYPPSWTAKKIYYQTAAQQAQGEHPENIGIELFLGKELKGDDFIAIGGRQVSCAPLEHHAKCYYISSAANYIYTDSNNPKILKAFDLFIKTIEVDETAYEINNAEYYSSYLKKKITLKNGEYYEKPDIMKTSFGIFISIEKVAMGDLNNDGKKDAAIVLRSYYEGGSISNYYLHILINENGKPNPLTYRYLGYGVKTNSINIQTGEIILDMMVHDKDDMPCCPTLNKIFRYKLFQNELKAVKDETVNWKTYENNEYGFEIKYPQDFCQSEEDSYIKIENCKLGEKPGHNPAVLIKTINTELSSSEWLDKNSTRESIMSDSVSCKGCIYYGINGTRDVYLNNIQALQFNSVAVSDSSLNTLIKIPQHDLLINIVRINSGFGKFPEDIYNQILSTFKFIEKDETAKCSSIDIPNYEVTKNNEGEPLEFYVGLNSNQKKEFVRVYREFADTGTRRSPIIVKIFSGTGDCPKENFRYRGSCCI